MCILLFSIWRLRTARRFEYESAENMKGGNRTMTTDRCSIANGNKGKTLNRNYCLSCFYHILSIYTANEPTIRWLNAHRYEIY